MHLFVAIPISLAAVFVLSACGSARESDGADDKTNRSRGNPPFDGGTAAGPEDAKSFQVPAKDDVTPRPERACSLPHCIALYSDTPTTIGTTTTSVDFQSAGLPATDPPTVAVTIVTQASTWQLEARTLATLGERIPLRGAVAKVIAIDSTVLHNSRLGAIYIDPSFDSDSSLTPKTDSGILTLGRNVIDHETVTIERASSGHLRVTRPSGVTATLGEGDALVAGGASLHIVRVVGPTEGIRGWVEVAP